MQYTALRLLCENVLLLLLLLLPIMFLQQLYGMLHQGCHGNGASTQGSHGDGSE